MKIKIRYGPDSWRTRAAWVPLAEIFLIRGEDGEIHAYWEQRFSEGGMVRSQDRVWEICPGRQLPEQNVGPVAPCGPGPA